jgi:hypothetical protein
MPIIDRLKQIVIDSETSESERARATTVLEFIARTIVRLKEELADNLKSEADDLGAWEGECLWLSPDRFEIDPATDKLIRRDSFTVPVAKPAPAPTLESETDLAEFA